MLVTMSGIDGSGKTSLTRRVAERLKQQSRLVKVIQPEYRANDVIKEFCYNNFGDRFAYFPNIDPNVYISALMVDWLQLLNAAQFDDAHCVILSDRYIYDVLAQAVHYGAELRFFLQLAASFPVPALSFFLDVSPATASAGLDARKNPPKNRLESLEHLTTLYGAYSIVRTQLHWEPLLLPAPTAAEATDVVVQRIIEACGC
jgi:thymidylate kinase